MTFFPVPFTFSRSTSSSRTASGLPSHRRRAHDFSPSSSNAAPLTEKTNFSDSFNAPRISIPKPLIAQHHHHNHRHPKRRSSSSKLLALRSPPKSPPTQLVDLASACPTHDACGKELPVDIEDVDIKTISFPSTEDVPSPVTAIPQVVATVADPQETLDLRNDAGSVGEGRNDDEAQCGVEPPVISDVGRGPPTSPPVIHRPIPVRPPTPIPPMRNGLGRGAPCLSAPVQTRGIGRGPVLQAPRPLSATTPKRRVVTSPPPASSPTSPTKRKRLNSSGSKSEKKIWDAMTAKPSSPPLPRGADADKDCTPSTRDDDDDEIVLFRMDVDSTPSSHIRLPAESRRSPSPPPSRPSSPTPPILHGSSDEPMDVLLQQSILLAQRVRATYPQSRSPSPPTTGHNYVERPDPERIRRAIAMMFLEHGNTFSSINHRGMERGKKRSRLGEVAWSWDGEVEEP